MKKTIRALLLVGGLFGSLPAAARGQSLPPFPAGDAKPSPAPTSSGQSAPPSASTGSEIDNARVVQMTKLGLGDEIIIAKIKTGNCKFALSDADLAELKKGGVSDKVVAAMLEASVLKSPRVTVDGNPVELHTFGQEKIGGRLGSTVTLGVKSVKEKAYLQGQHASVFASATATIQIELPPNDTIDNYILVRLDGKGDRRELEIASGGGAVGHKRGVRAEKIVKTSYEPVSGRIYKITLGESLKSGDYVLYIVGSADFEKGIFGRGYDFAVE